MMSNEFGPRARTTPQPTLVPLIVPATPLQVTPATPDSVSVTVPAAVTVGANTIAPFAGDTRVNTGGARSRLTEAEAVEALPALSIAVPVTTWFAPSVEI